MLDPLLPLYLYMTYWEDFRKLLGHFVGGMAPINDLCQIQESISTNALGSASLFTPLLESVDMAANRFQKNYHQSSKKQNGGT